MFLIATRTPFFLVEAQAEKVVLKFLCVQRGGLEAWKWVSCTQRMSHVDSSASFHREDRLAGWLRPFALMVRILMVIVVVDYMEKLWLGEFEEFRMFREEIFR